jgi:RNA polymerase sigma factor (sigma-70 family)
MKEKKRSSIPIEDCFEREASMLHHLSPEKKSLRKELQKKLNQAIDSLPDPYKMSFILVIFQGMSHSQASEVLRCSENTVSWRMFKARKMLRSKLLPYLGGNE